ncbi:MAG TPA: NAD(P)/FAD-dependent oxidoreductase [Acidimicrobiia bacterium]|nr:NAD(P)/FAD-dependent oxidoreductase [Acidimicrobiia bacterium]
MTNQQAAADVIVVGAGHNGLTCAAYLARAGLRVLVVEGEDHIGGGTATRELTLPGFRHNSCANYFHGFGTFPISRDLQLPKYGFEYLLPDVQQAYLFSDDRALVIHRDLEPTLRSVGRFSAKDARTWELLTERFTPALPLFIATQFTPPGESASLAAIALSEGMVSQALSEELTTLGRMKPYDAVDSYFEDEHVRVLFKKLIHVIQATNSPGFGSILPAFFLNLTRNGLAKGGSQTLPDALAAIVVEAGGEIRAGSPVERILLSDGRAIGVRLQNGDEIEAVEALVAAVDFTQLVEMTGPEHFGPAVREKAQNWDWTSGGSLATLHLALKEPPRYRAAEFDPDVAHAFNISFGADDSAQLEESMADVIAGAFPRVPVGNGACDSLLDPTYTDGDGHVAFWWPFAPYVVDGDHHNWDNRREEYTRRLLDAWKSFAPNLEGDNTLAVHLRTPLDVSRGNAAMRNGGVRMGPYTPEQSGKNRPHPDLADYRVPGLIGLYHASSTSPNGGGVSGAAGYCAAGAIADDLAVERWWPRMSLAYATELAGA